MSGFIHEDLPVVTEVEAPTRDEVLVVLEEGLRRVQKGWTRYKEYERVDHQEFYCALGAIRYQRDVPHQVTVRAEVQLERALPSTYRTVWEFNDTRLLFWPRKRGVVKLYKRAIKARLAKSI